MLDFVSHGLKVAHRIKSQNYCSIIIYIKYRWRSKVQSSSIFFCILHHFFAFARYNDTVVEHFQDLRLHEFINTQYYPSISYYRHTSCYSHLYTPLKVEITFHFSPHLGILFIKKNDTLNGKNCRIAVWNKTNDNSCTVRKIYWKKQMKTDWNSSTHM